MAADTHLRLVPPQRSKPLLEENLSPTQQARIFLNGVAELDPLSGDGSPEGVQSAKTRRFYSDMANELVYFKFQDQIDGDPTQGWGLVSPAPVVEITIEDSYTITTTDGIIITCNNTESITITMPALLVGQNVSVIRANTGAVTIDGAGETIIGETTQTLPLQYDVVNMYGIAAEWVLGS